MGLDMYLHKKTYVKNWDHQRPEERHEITVKLGGQAHPHIKPERISEITEQVAYWRKANAIHKWFVDNVQDGRDECQESYVEREQLAELVARCKEVLNSVETIEPGQVIAQPALANTLLPTQDGFFFGSTDYGQYYLADLRDTVAQLEPLLAEEGGAFYYRASW